MTIDLIKFVLDGDEDNVLKFYRKIYNSGVDPKIFINEYLETLYYIKNIDFMNLDETNFDLNDEEFNKIKNLSKNISKKNLLLLWQFTLNNIEKIDIIKNQHQFVEMFLIRSIYLNKILSKNQNFNLTRTKQEATHLNLKEKKDDEIKQDTIDQIKNTEQKEKIISPKSEQNKLEEIQIKSFQDLIVFCEKKRELKIKYELENNLRLVNFESQKIEISFNSNLEKSFVKELTAKLLAWTGKRWMIAFSKESGSPTLKEQRKKIEKDILNKENKSEFSKNIKKIFPDAQLLKAEEDN